MLNVTQGYGSQLTMNTSTL